MAVFKCKMCGANLEVTDCQTVVTCEFCGSTQTVSSADDDKRVNLFNRANSLRIKNEFDKSFIAYQSIIAEFPNDAEAYWGVCLCKYGIEYVDDPRSGEKVPTCHRTLFDSILDDQDYLSALKYADSVSKGVYEAQAREIDRLQKHIIKISQKEEPYDIFICYKETDEAGRRTQDSVIAHDIYDRLTANGYKVFFARITLEGKLGQEYEPIIFAALRSSKVMLAIGTKLEYFNAVWVKNEWSRFLSLMKDDRDKYLIPCYKDIDAYDMPEEFLALQSQDLGKLGFLQDLSRGIDKIFNRDKTKKVTVVKAGAVDLSSYFSRLDRSIAEKKYEKAEFIIEEILQIDPNNARAIFSQLLIRKGLGSVGEMISRRLQIEDEPEYIEALEKADPEYKEELLSYPKKIKESILMGIYNEGFVFKEMGQYEDAIVKLEEVGDFKDAKELIEECKSAITERKYAGAHALFKNKDFLNAKIAFFELGDYKDSKEMVEIVKQEQILVNVEKQMPHVISSGMKISFNKLISDLESIKDYKDVAERIEKYQGLFAKKQALEAQRKKKKKIITIVVSSIIAFLTIFFILLGTVIVPASKYSKGVKAFKEGRYSESRSYFADTLWKDTQNQRLLLDAQSNFKNGHYSDGIRNICKAGGTVNIKYECDKGEFEFDTSTFTNYSEFKTPEWTCPGYKLKTTKDYYSNKDSEEYGDSFSLTSYKIDNTPKKYSANIVLTAQYCIATYKIRAYIYENYYSPTIYSYKMNDSIGIDNPYNRNGYIFLGWQGGPFETPTIDAILPVGTYGDFDLIGIWEPIQYTINYHLDGGSTTNPATYTIENYFSLSDATKSGYEFAGWYTDSSFNSNYRVYSIPTGTGEIDLYAKFTAKTYSYFLDAGEGLFTNPKTSAQITYNYNYDGKKDVVNVSQGSTIPNKNISRSNYKFVGWFTDKTLTNEYLFNSEVVDDMELFAKWDYSTYDILYGTKSVPTTAFSNYSGNETQSFRFYVGEGGTFKISHYYYFTSPTYYSDYYTCNIYLTVSNETSGNTYYSGTMSKSTTSVIETANRNDVIYVSVRSVGSSNTSNYKPKASISLTAPGLPSRTSNSIVNLPSKVSSFTYAFTYNEDVTLPTPSRSGYTFMGWKYNDVLLPNHIEHWNIPNDATLIASWQENT